MADKPQDADDSFEAHAIASSDSVSAFQILTPVDKEKKKEFDDIFDLVGIGPMQAVSLIIPGAYNAIEGALLAASGSISNMIYSSDEDDKGNPSDLPPPPPRPEGRGR